MGKTISLYSALFFTSWHGYKLCLRVSTSTGIVLVEVHLSPTL